MVMNILGAIGLFFIQPTFLLGMIAAIALSANRKKRERKLFRVAINKYNDEIIRFLSKGLWIGLISSILTIGLGVPITFEVAIFYQIFAVVGLLIGGHFVHPLFTLTLSIATAAGIEYFSLFERLPANIQQWYQGFNQMEWTNFSLVQNVLLISSVITALTAINLKLQKNTRLSPKFVETKRGKRNAVYQMIPFWLIPLVVVIPGEIFTAFFDWWPVLSIGNETYSFFILPLLGGFKYTVQSQVPKEAAIKFSNELFAVSILGLIGFAGSFWNEWISLAGIALLLIGGLFVLVRHHLREKKGVKLYAPAEEGIKIIGIRPDTPAEKMQLQVGENLLVCNEVLLETEDDFYAALAKNSVYCHLKVKGIDGEPRLTETALYEDDPYGMGIVFLTK